jgi:signal transduction histidine kinase
MFVLAFALALSVLSWRRYRAGVVEARKLAATQQALRTSQAEAEHANQAKSLFLANVSHELRTPLTSLIGTNELLQDTALTPEQGRFVKIMDRAGQRLLALVTDILDFSKLEAGTLRLRSVPLNLGILTYDVIALMRPAAQAKGLPIEHRLSCEPDVPDTLVGDPERIAQVLTILLDNAIKFSTSGVVRLSTSVSTDGPESALVVFAVSDEGIGIPEKSHGSLFEAFSQLDDSMTREHTGTGLGLAICADLVKMMDGSIEVASRLGKGSTFTVELPLVASSEPPVRLDGGSAQPPIESDPEERGSRDNKMDAMPAGWYRSGSGHSVHRYWNGESWTA